MNWLKILVLVRQPVLNSVPQVPLHLPMILKLRLRVLPPVEFGPTSPTLQTRNSLYVALFSAKISIFGSNFVSRQMI